MKSVKFSNFIAYMSESSFSGPLLYQSIPISSCIRLQLIQFSLQSVVNFQIGDDWVVAFHSITLIWQFQSEYLSRPDSRHSFVESNP